jgi:hypothetical protein
MRKTRRLKFDFCDILAVSAILLGVAVIGGIVYTYDLHRQTALDDARAQAYLDSRQVHKDR